jgi:hypothetical protein
MSAKQFREFARECVRWAEEASSDGDRRHFIEMAKAWMHAAAEFRELTHHPEPPGTQSSDDTVSDTGNFRVRT